MNYNHTQIKEICSKEIEPTFTLGVSTDIIKDGRYLLVDTNINSREVLGSITPENIYTVTGINKETVKWKKHLKNDHIFQSVSVNGIREDSGITTLAAFIENGDNFESTVDFNSLDEIVNCDYCGVPVRGTLTSDSGTTTSGTTTYVCPDLSEPDQELLVWTVAFPEKFMLITNDGCLGWSSRLLNSYCLRKDKEKYWKYYF